MSLDLFTKSAILIFVTIFAGAFFMMTGSYVGDLIPFTKGDGFDWWWVLSMSSGSFVGAAIAAPFLYILFEKRRWLAALFVSSPLLLLTHSKIYMETLFLFLLYFSLLIIGMWLSACILKTSQTSNR